MGNNLDLNKMLGVPRTVQCPRCRRTAPTFSDDYDVECGDPNPDEGFWDLGMYCPECEHEWTMRFAVDLVQVPPERQCQKGRVVIQFERDKSNEEGVSMITESTVELAQGSDPLTQDDLLEILATEVGTIAEATGISLGQVLTEMALGHIVAHERYDAPPSCCTCGAELDPGRYRCDDCQNPVHDATEEVGDE